VTDLIRSSATKRSGTKELLKDASKLAAEPDGFNIEGLTSTPDGHLLFGLRGPRKDGKAILIEIRNPMEIIAENSHPPKFDVHLLDLGNAENGGNGVRTVEYVADEKTYLVVAGPGGDGGPFHLYSWTGPGETVRHLGPIDLSQVAPGSTPEALIVHPTRHIQLLWDEGGRKTNGVACKDLQKDADKSFSGFRLALRNRQPPDS
jgi:hypothetical protein